DDISFDPVTVLNLSNSTYNSAGIDWTLPADNGETFLNYMVNYTSPYGTAVTYWENKTSVGETSSILTGLTPNTQYTAQVSVYSTLGYTDWGGKMLNFTTLNPIFDPTTVTAGTVSSSEVELNWSLPTANDGAQFLNYMINFTTPHGTAITFVSNQTDTSETITGLTTLTDYSFQLATYDALTGSVDWGGNILNVTTTDFDPPGTPTLGAIALSDVALRYTSVPGSAGHNSTIWYALQCELNGSGGWLATVSNSSYINPHEIGGFSVGDVN
ncbi:unnamed protein product, partial [marine sediment metagenome]